MSKFILIHGDTVEFPQVLGAANLLLPPMTTIKGSGPATLNGKKLCVDGDEKKVKIDNCPYIAGAYSIPGKGTLTIQALGTDQKASKIKTGGKAVLLQGSNFTAKFEVKTQAKQPPPGPGSPVPDPMPQYSGKGKFTTTNTLFQGA